MTGDPELLRQYAETRSEAAFAELVRRHLDFVYGVAFRHSRNAHRAQDVAQTVFIDLARKAGLLARRAELVGWLYLAARHAAAKIARSEARREAREREAAMSSVVEAGAPAEAEWSRLKPVLDDALEGLGERDRSAVLLRHVRGWSFAEVGSALHVSEEAARKRVERALDRLRAQLARRGVPSTAAALGLALADQAAIAAPSGLAASISGAALAGAGPAGPLATLLHLLSTSKIVAGAAALAGALAITAAFHETRAAQTAQAALASADRGYDRLFAQVESARQAEAAARRREADQARAAGSRAAGPAGGDSAAASDAEAAARRRALFGQPSGTAPTESLRAAGRKFVKQSSLAVYWELNRFLKLTPDQMDQIAEIFADTNNMNINGVAVPGNPPSAAMKGYEQVGELLGSAAWDFGRQAAKIPYLSLTMEYASYAAGDEPLAEPQAEQLASVLASHHVMTRPSAWPAALSAASSVLSPGQLALLSTYATSKTGVAYPAQAQAKP